MEYLENCPICSGETMYPFLSCKDYLLTEEVFTIVQCSKCGFRFTNPRPLAAQLGKYYKSDEYISHSDSRTGIFNRIYQAVRTLTIKRKYRLLQSLYQNGSLLDIGCATGDFLLYMQYKGWSVTGIEPDENARLKATTRGLNVFDENFLDQLDAGSFDIITLWHVLEHVSELQERMRQIMRLLKPGGRLVIAVPNSHSFDALHYKENWAGYDVPRHLYHFTRTTMKMLIQNSGLEFVGIHPMKWDSFYVSLLSEKNKLGKLSWITGIGNGLWSNYRALASGEYSSLIYIAKKRKSN